MEKSTSLQEASHVSLFPAWEKEQEERMTATSGLKCYESQKLEGPIGSWLKMCLESSTWDSTRCSLIWSVKDTPQRRSVFQLAPSPLPTIGPESGWWRTIRAGESTEWWENVQARRERMRKAGDTQTGDLMGLTQQAQRLDGKRGMVRPEFAEWLMGYPRGYTDLETPSCHKSPMR